jgi:DNA-binding transcriptional ArsR family regulator
MEDAKQLARVLKVLAVGTRVEIVRLLKGRVLCVNALAARLDVTQGAVSQHLRIMRDAGLVVDEKRGYFVHYRLNEKTLVAWREQIDRLLDPVAGAGPQMKGARPCAAAETRRKAARGPKT